MSEILAESHMNSSLSGTIRRFLVRREPHAREFARDAITRKIYDGPRGEIPTRTGTVYSAGKNSKARLKLMARIYFTGLMSRVSRARICFGAFGF